MRIVIAVVMLLLQAAVPVQALQLTSDAAQADYADVRADGSGYIHVVYTADDAADGRALFYRMLSSGGTVLIDTTRIDAAGKGPAAYPAMVMDSAGQVYVVWQSGASPEIYLTRLDPSLDDRDGSAADPVFKEIPDTMISGAGGDNGVHPRLTIDADLRLHVVWENACTGPVQYNRITFDAATGLPEVGTPVPLGGTGSCNDLPDVALDTDGDVHVVFANAGGAMADEIWYAMLDGGTGDVLIDATRLSEADDLQAGSATVSVNPFDDQVFVVYKEETGAGGDGSERIFMSVLDPSKVNKDGSSADPGVLQIDHRQLALGGGLFRWQVFARIGSDRRVHVLYTDVDYTDVDAQTCSPGPYTIQHAHVIYDGEILKRGQLTATATAQSCAVQARLGPYTDRLVWTDSISGSQEIHTQTFRRAEGDSSGFTCSLGRAGSGMAQAGDVWLLLAVIAGLGSRYRRRRCA